MDGENWSQRPANSLQHEDVGHEGHEPVCSTCELLWLLDLQ